MFLGNNVSLKSQVNSESILGFSVVFTTSKTQSISKLKDIRRMVINKLPTKNSEAAVSVKQKLISHRKSTLFCKNNINNVEIKLLESVNNKYNAAYNTLGKKTVTVFFKNIFEKLLGFSNSSLKIITVVKKYFVFYAATKYFTFFFKISKNSVGRRLWKNLVSQFLTSFTYSKYVNDSDRLGCVDFPDYFLYDADGEPEGLSSEDTETESEEVIELEDLGEEDIEWKEREPGVWEEEYSEPHSGMRALTEATLEDIYFTKNVRTILRAVKQLPSVATEALGYDSWSKKSSGLHRANFTNIKELLLSYYGKNIFRRQERLSTALGYFVNRSKNFGSFYHTSAILLGQSWGNFGSHINGNTIKYAFCLNYTYNRYVMYANILEKDLCDFYSHAVANHSADTSVNSFDRFDSNGDSDDKIKISKTYLNWLKAGYVILNDFGNYDSRVNVVATSTEENNMFSFSKVFGHPFHLVNPSILPLTLSFVFFTLIQDVLSSFCLEMWYSSSFSVLAHATMIGLFFSVILSWLFEVYSEEQAGCHTLEVQSGFKYAVLLFILSELMLFVSFFWAYFHFSLNSNSFTGGTYAARGIVPFYATRIPFLNTLLLLSSGLSLTIAHTLIVESDKLTKASIWLDVLAVKLGAEWNNLCNEATAGYTIAGYGHPVEYFFVALELYQKRVQQVSTRIDASKKRGLALTNLNFDNKENCVDRMARLSNDSHINLPKSFLIEFKYDEKNVIWQPNYWILDTVLKGFVFLIFQAYEYTSCMFSMNDSVYGAVFFSLTGLHGVHVYLGVMFLLFGLLVNLKKNMSRSYFKSEEEYDCCIDRFNSRGAFLKSSMNSKIWTHRVAFDGAAWYWHFVDVVWFFVFVFVYVWGYATTPYLSTSN